MDAGLSPTIPHTQPRVLAEVEEFPDRCLAHTACAGDERSTRRICPWGRMESVTDADFGVVATSKRFTFFLTVKQTSR
jgi:hypothetical protein